MNNLTALIVDDEEDGRNTLKSFLEKYCPQLGMVATAASVQEALLQVRTLNPGIVFLDINMPYESGFDLFTHLPDPDFHTIFVTAHDEYALQAIKHHALDYILKPINIDELIAAVDRALALLSRPAAPSNISGLLQSIQRAKAVERIALPVLDGFIYVQLNEIIRCEAEGNYTIFYFTNRSKLMVCRTLGSYEDQLRDIGFVRVHNHHLINIAHVEKYQRGRGGIITMSDKTDVSVSQRRKDDFLKIIEQAHRI